MNPTSKRRGKDADIKENTLAPSFMRIIIEKLKMALIAYSGLMTPAGRYYLEGSLKA